MGKCWLVFSAVHPMQLLPGLILGEALPPCSSPLLWSPTLTPLPSLTRCLSQVGPSQGMEVLIISDEAIMISRGLLKHSCQGHACNRSVPALFACQAVCSSMLQRSAHLPGSQPAPPAAWVIMPPAPPHSPQHPSLTSSLPQCMRSAAAVVSPSTQGTTITIIFAVAQHPYQTQHTLRQG
jgi:hypothetical protein